MINASVASVAEMREIVAKATEGPWEWPSRLNGEFSIDGCDRDGRFVIATPNSNFEWSKPTARFIATFNPATVTELLDRLEKAEATADQCRHELKMMLGRAQRYKEALEHISGTFQKGLPQCCYDYEDDGKIEDHYFMIARDALK